MKCLTCSAETIQKMVEGVEIDLCINCGGIWLDGGELEVLTNQTLKDSRKLKCPKCGVVMLIRTVGPVEVDHCVKCGGTWLDKGELETIFNSSPRGEPSAKGITKFKDSVGRTRNLEIAKKEISNEKASLDGIVDEVFVMYKDGLLITCSSKKIEEGGVNEDLLAGTLMTIQDFVEVSFGKSGESQLKEIRFGNRQILIERGDNIITAIVASGNVPDNFNEDVQEVIKNIEDRYRVNLKNWDGNLGQMDGVQELLTDLMNKQAAEKHQKGPAQDPGRCDSTPSASEGKARSDKAPGADRKEGEKNKPGPDKKPPPPPPPE